MRDVRRRNNTRTGTFKDMRKNIEIIWEKVTRFIPGMHHIEPPSGDMVPATKSGRVIQVRCPHFEFSESSQKDARRVARNQQAALNA